MQEVTVYSNSANGESRPDGRIGLGAICGGLCLGAICGLLC